jgi:hypothetical protein
MQLLVALFLSKKLKMEEKKERCKSREGDLPGVKLWLFPFLAIYKIYGLQT